MALNNLQILTNIIDKMAKIYMKVNEKVFQMP